jgi:purine-binding chemotaxis protein CheW
MSDTRDGAVGGAKEFVTVTIAGQQFGIPVLAVQDVLGSQRIARIPLASPEVAGALNLRGRIVTAIDLRRRLGLPGRAPEEKSMSVVVDHHGEFYSLIVDAVGEVLSLPDEAFEPNPATLDPLWRGVSAGIFRLQKSLLVVFDVERLLELGPTRRAA